MALHRPFEPARKTRKLGRLWFRYFVEEIFGRGYFTERAEKEEHQMFISLQLSDSSLRPERFELPTF